MLGLNIATKFKGLNLQQIERLKKLIESGTKDFEFQRPTKMRFGSIKANGKIDIDFSQAMIAPDKQFLKYNDYGQQFDLKLVRTSTGETIEGTYVG